MKTAIGTDDSGEFNYDQAAKEYREAHSSLMERIFASFNSARTLTQICRGH